MSNDKYDDQVDHDLDADLGDEYFDDFDDHDSTSEVDGDWDEMEEAQSYEQPKKKKKSLSNIVIVVIAVIAGLGFLVFKFGGSPDSSPAQAVEVAGESPVQVSDMQNDVTPVDSTMEEVPSPVASDLQPLPDQQEGIPSQLVAENSGPLTPMPADADVAQNEQVPAPLLQDIPAQEPPALMTSPDVVQQAVVPVPSEPMQETVPAEQGQDSPPLLQPVSDFPSADMIKKVETTPSSVPEPVVEEAPVSAPAIVEQQESPPAVQPQESAELDQAMGKIRDLETSVEKNTQVIEDYEDQVRSLKDKIANLEGQLDQASKRAAPVAEETVVVKAVKPEERVRPVVEKQSPAVEAAPARWILKGAQPGRALLAADNQKQEDVRTVTIGDKVPGLGTVLSIEKGQSGWVVIGTGGRVTQ